MSEMADFALDGLSDEDEAQMRTLGYSNVFGRRYQPLSEDEEFLLDEEGGETR